MTVEHIGDVAVKRGDHVELEAALLAHLGAATDPRYRVQELVRVDGDALVTRWIDGVHKSYTEIARDEWGALGRELAALHDRLDAYDGPIAKLSQRPRDLDGERAALEALAVHAELAAHVRAQIAMLEECGPRARIMPADRERPIHDDYNQFNYLFDGRTPPVILDWEGAIGAPREYEVVRCMNHLPLVGREMADAFVGGYRGERALDAAKLAWAVDAALTEHAVKRWPLERWIAGGARGPLPGSVAVLRALAGARDTLVDYFTAFA